MRVTTWPMVPVYPEEMPHPRPTSRQPPFGLLIISSGPGMRFRPPGQLARIVGLTIIARGHF